MVKQILISSSLLGRRKELGGAVWTWLWMVSNSTQIRDTGNGNVTGLVADGDRIKVETIADALGLSTGAVRKHITTLENAGMVSRMVAGGEL